MRVDLVALVGALGGAAILVNEKVAALELLPIEDVNSRRGGRFVGESDEPVPARRRQGLGVGWVLGVVKLGNYYLLLGGEKQNIIIYSIYSITTHPRDLPLRPMMTLASVGM